MKVKFKSSLILLLGWFCLILVAGIVSGRIGWKLGTKSLSEVDESPILKRQYSSTLLKENSPKIISENEILLKVSNYIKIEQEQLNKSEDGSNEQSKQ